MPTMIAIPNYDAKYVQNSRDGSRSWQRCRVVGVSNTTSGPQLVVQVHRDDGRITAETLFEVFDVDAEMPTQ